MGKVSLVFKDEDYTREGVSDFIVKWVSKILKDPQRISFTKETNRNGEPRYKFTDINLGIKGEYREGYGNTYYFYIRQLRVNDDEISYILMKLKPLFKERDRRYKLVKAKKLLREHMEQHNTYQKLLEGEK